MVRQWALPVLLAAAALPCVTHAGVTGLSVSPRTYTNVDANDVLT